MWIYFNETGTLLESLTHGTPARVGATNFEIFAYFENIDIDQYSVATITLKKPDMSQSIYLQLQMQIKNDNKFTVLPDENPVKFVNGQRYSGYYFDFNNFTTEEDTVILLDTPGVWTASITLYSSDPTYRSVSGIITFNVQGTAYPTEETELIMQAILGNLSQQMSSLQPKYSANNVRGYDTLAEAEGDVGNLSENQIVYVSDPGEFYQKVSGSLVKVDNNDIEQRDYTESTPLQTIYEEVGIGKLFFMEIDGHWTLMRLYAPTEDSFAFYFWNELGYGETDATEDLTDSINNLSFHYTGSYFPYVEKNDLSGSLTDNELAILSQPNSVFICLGNIMHKVSSTRFERNSVSTSGTNMNISTQYITINTSTKTFTFNTSYISSYNASGIDSLLAQKQNLLINQFNIKSINGQSILGSGDLTVGGGSVAEWGNIGGDIQDQTDLQNELQDIREVAEGKCKVVVLSYQKTAPTTNAQAQELMKIDGTYFTDLADFNSYVSGMTIKNSIFNSQNDYVNFYYVTGYLISDDNVVYRGSDINTFRKGDIFIITETVDSNGDTLPDRWLSFVPLVYQLLFYKLETGKVDLTNYATKTELANAIASLNANLAGLYDSTLTYSVGEIVIYDNKLYTCTTAITTPEAWDSTHWTQTTIANEFVNLHGSQVIDGEKTLGSNDNPYVHLAFHIVGNYRWRIGTIVGNSFEIARYASGTLQYGYNFGNTGISPKDNNARDLGADGYSWRDLHLTRYLTDNTNSYTIAESMAQFNPSVAGTTVIKWSQFCSFSLSADTTLTLETTKTDCLCEYKANITNSGGSDITITLPSGTVIKGNVSISNNTFVIPSGSSVEVNIQNNKAIVVEW